MYGKAVCAMVLLATILANAACQTAPPGTAGASDGGEGDEARGFAFNDVLWVPLASEPEELLIHAGPIIITRQPYNVAYRVIGPNELEIAGTDKPAYDFFTSAFSNPTGLAEQTLVKALGQRAQPFPVAAEGIELFKVESSANTRLYVVSRQTEFALEIVANTTDRSFVDELAQQVHLRRGHLVPELWVAAD